MTGWPSLDSLTLQRDGAQIFRSAMDDQTLERLTAGLSAQPADQAGIRLFGLPELQALIAADGPIGSLLEKIANGARPVRAILFDKTPSANWALGWHQDRVVAVREK